jgi:hypothetical protein
MVSIININHGIQEHTHGYQNSNTSLVLIFGGYVKVRESLYAQVLIWVKINLDYIDTRVIVPRSKGPCMAYRPKWY